MFKGCNNLTNIDVSNFDTKNVTDMSGMFDSCNNLTNIDVANFDTNNVTDMGCMFYGCNNLTNLILIYLNCILKMLLTSLLCLVIVIN